MSQRDPQQSVVGKVNALPNHLSYSSKDSLERCAKAYYLGRIAHAPQRPALWLAGGSAVHSVTELWDRDPGIDVAATWQREFDKTLEGLRELDADVSRWRQTKQGVDQWRLDGLDYVQSWITWRQRAPWKIWVTPDGSPAIELDVAAKLPGCEAEIAGFVDRIFHDPILDRLYIVDLKTGTRKPDSPAQFGTYAALVAAKYDVKITWGAAFMNRKGELTTPFDLTKYTPEYVGMTYGRAWQQIKAGGFNARIGEHCFLCDVQEACYANGGMLSERFDPDDPQYQPPF